MRARLPSPRASGNTGFTLLEIVGVCLILGILATLSIPVLKGFRGRAEGLQCKANLQALGLGAQAYIDDHKSWPQIVADKPGANSAQQLTPGSGDKTLSYAEQWIAAFEPYGISEKVWRCPSIEKQIKAQGNPEALKQKRLDYTPTRFDSRPESPRQWPKHPWFIERGALHGNGPNILFADGTISSVDELFKGAR